VQFFLAAFDQSHLCPDGSYWSWKHSAIPLSALDTFIYDVANRHRPDQNDRQSVGGFSGGCASVDDDWTCCYRFL
jgi:hypothetical protein